MKKITKIRNKLVELYSRLYNYLQHPCSWKYHRCTDFPDKCHLCNRNNDLWKNEQKSEQNKKTHSYFDPVWEHYH